MTAYARTLLKKSYDENYSASNPVILATLGSLEARLVKLPDTLTKVAETSAEKDMKKDHDEWLIIVSEKGHASEKIASCHMILTGHLRFNEKLEAACLGDSFEVVGEQHSPVFLAIAPFEFFNKAKTHRAQGLLWQAITHFCILQNVDYVIGSLAFESRYPAAHALELSYLHHFCRSQSGVHLRANHGVTMDIMPEEAINPVEAFSCLPPMLRYCLRIGAKVADNAVIDRNNNETRIFLLFSAKTVHA
ncbi:hypothetical protein [uncultured Bartonella sp.]|uniref:hypothetical protein n=1 Tax=uncultured Bartonella sp. TaxID=104108 RepID=UPI002621E811|nr:hypothetical protein [uncultured Bartonella sp.]